MPSDRPSTTNLTGYSASSPCPTSRGRKRSSTEAREEVARQRVLRRRHFLPAQVNDVGFRGIFVRMPFVAPQDRCIRISCGTDADLDILETTLPEALAAARR